MIERKVIHLATAMGAALWLVRIVFSRSERRKLDAAMQALDSVTASR
ncbi:hypothetical protein PQR53_35160 [Paraburkholderia fungorum]